MDLSLYVSFETVSLFAKDDLQSVMDKRHATMKQEVEGIQSDRFLNTSTSDLAKYLAEKYSLDPIVLHEEQGSVEHKEIKIDISKNSAKRFMYDHHGGGPFFVDGTRVLLHIPFSGDESLFYFRPDVFQSGGAKGALKNGSLILCVDSETDDPGSVNRDFEQSLQHLRAMLGFSSIMVARFNAQVPERAMALVNARRERLLKANNMVAGLNFPVRKRAGESETYVVPTVRKRVVPVLPSAPGGAFKPDPTIEMSVYEDILRSLQSMSLVMERSPTPLALRIPSGVEQK